MGLTLRVTREATNYFIWHFQCAMGPISNVSPESATLFDCVIIEMYEVPNDEMSNCHNFFCFQHLKHLYCK